MSNEELRSEIAAVAANVYPGMFDEEVQATIKVGDREVTVFTSKSNVVTDRAPSETGTPGRLKVYLVDVSEKGFLIDLPGEALGATRRLRVDKSMVHRMD